MNYVGPRRQLNDQISTGDIDAYLRFISLNLCGVSSAAREYGRAASDAPFQADARACSAGEFTVARLVTHSGKAALNRVHDDVRYDAERRYVVCLALAGDIQVQQQVHDHRCTPGSMFMLSGSE